MKIDWSQIQTVLLDMDGTLLDLHFDSYFWGHYLPRVYAERNQLTEQETARILDPLFEDHAGTLNWYCVNFWSDALQLDIMQLKGEVAHNIGYRPAAQEFLAHCQEQVDDLRLVTNSHREVLDLKIRFTELDRYFDYMICSHELGAPKEDVRFWGLLQELRGFDPEATLFIDDSESVLDAAVDFGLKHVYSIAAPDSSRDRDTGSKYPMIETFFTKNVA